MTEKVKLKIKILGGFYLMQKIKNGILLGLTAGATSSLTNSLLNNIENKLIANKYEDIFASILKKHHESKNKMDFITSAATGIVTNYTIIKTGRKSAALKGMGIGALSWLFFQRITYENP